VAEFHISYLISGQKSHAAGTCPHTLGGCLSCIADLQPLSGHRVLSALHQKLLSADKLLWHCYRRCTWSPSSITTGQQTAWPAAVPSAKVMRMQMSLMMTRRSLVACWCARAPPAVPSQQGTRASAAGTRASASASLKTCLCMLMTALQGEFLFTSLFPGCVFVNCCLLKYCCTSVALDVSSSRGA